MTTLNMDRFMYREQITPVVVPHRIAMHGSCELDTPHEAHIFPDPDVTQDNAGNYMFWDCPGQYAECRNCDDRLCMSCVLREVHDYCENDCPMCC